MFSTTAWEYSIIGDIVEDVTRMLIALTMISTYSMLVLGSCSPVHFRAVTSMVGLSCVVLAGTAGYGLSFAFKQLISRFHGFLPFMLMGIGVDDMFVIVSCVDQTPMHLSANERFRIGLIHAGPSITITSVTDALAFFVGSFSDVPALRSFCNFSAICVLTLYFSFLTIFSPWFIHDMRRQESRRGDCFGLCCCKEDSVFCFRGHFLNNR